MTRYELAREIYMIKKDNLPNVTGLKRPLTESEFIKRYLERCGCTKGFKKSELETILKGLKGE